MRFPPLFPIYLLLLAVALTLSVAWLAEHDAARACLPKEQVEKWADEGQQPDHGDPEHRCGQGMVVFQDHDCQDDVAHDWDKDKDEKQQRIGDAASIAIHRLVFSL
jgi:hypothetical protein